MTHISEPSEATSPQITLTKGQETVVCATPETGCLVVAGPGAGKTQIAAMRIAFLLRCGLHPGQILVLSFSRSAVGNLATRLASLGLEDVALAEDVRHLTIKTFDSWAFRVLRGTGFSASELIRSSYETNIDRVTQAIDKKDPGLVDRLGGIRHVIVDEFQDLPGARGDMIASLLSYLRTEHRKSVGFTVLGDPAQAIYQFAARVNARVVSDDPWSELRQRIGGDVIEVSLDENHRSPAELGVGVIALRNVLRSPDLGPSEKLGSVKAFLSELPLWEAGPKLDAKWLEELPAGSLAVLTRTNGEALGVWQALVGTANEGASTAITVRLAGANQPAPAWIAEILSRYKHSSISRSMFEKAYKRVSDELGANVRREIGMPELNVAWPRLLRASGANNDALILDLTSLRRRFEWTDSFPDEGAAGHSSVTVTTVHQAKGMEFDNVALLGERESKLDDHDEALEEANVGFVAITRAKRHLYRLPAEAIYDPPTRREFEHGRVRQVAWGVMTKLQMGLPGDIDPVSLVDPVLHGSASGVEEFQGVLARNAVAWRNRKVVLRLDASDFKDVRYKISLQVDDGDGQLLGRTSNQLTLDLLRLLWRKGYGLPRVIYNLRLGEVHTTCFDGEMPDYIPDPWRSSRFWLGVSLNGTGDFKTRKRNAR